MRPRQLPILFLCLWSAILAACSGPEEPFPAGPAFETPVTFELAIFYPGPPREDPRAALEALLGSDFPGFTRLEEIREEEIGDHRVLHAIWVTDARASYPSPDAENLRYSGRGLDSAQVEALQRSDQVLRLRFGHGDGHRWTGLRDALRLASALARRTGGLLWDEETREMFTPAVWDEERLAAWPEATGVPDLRRHFTIHAYRRAKGYHRAISLGLAKVGLPDIVIEELPSSSTNSMMNTINLLAQALAEGAAIGDRGAFDLDIRRIRHPVLREKTLASLVGDATGKARLRLVQGTREGGDPENRLIELAFDRYPGPDLPAEQQQLVEDLLGADQDSVANVQHDEEVLAASRRARKKLLELKPSFLAGPQPGETLLVKAPFLAPDGTREWMWVDVIEWRGELISGTLRNEPFHATQWTAGQRVQVLEEDVLDYIRRRADGSEEGNETAKYLYPGRK